MNHILRNLLNIAPGLDSGAGAPVTNQGRPVMAGWGAVIAPALVILGSLVTAWWLLAPDPATTGTGGLAALAVLWLMATAAVVLLRRWSGQGIRKPLQELARIAEAPQPAAASVSTALLRRDDDIGALARSLDGLRRSLLSTLEKSRRDENVLQQTIEALFREKDQLQVTLASIGDGVITTDNRGVVEYINRSAKQITGLSDPRARGRPLSEVLNLVDEHSGDVTAEIMRRCIDEGEALRLGHPTLVVRHNEDERDVQVSASPIRARDLSINGAVIVFRDVTEERSLSRRLSYQATHDALTGLVNRFEFERRLRRMMDKADPDSRHSLCYLDLDQFKVVNDTSGHEAGDRLLREVTGVIRRHIRNPRDTLARLGGDEFAILLEHCPPAAAERIANEICEDVSRFRFSAGEHVFSVGVSIGIVNIEPMVDTATGVLKAADTACYLAKDAGRNRAHVYRPDEEQTRTRQGELAWVARMTEALEQDRFLLAFQPIVALDQTGGPDRFHYELLLRLQGADLEVLPPGAFLPAAERYSMGGAIDAWVINHALKWLGANRDHLQRLELCCINLSGQSLGNRRTLDTLRDALERYEVPADRLCFEITETAAVANFSSAVALMQDMKALGCRFALDDFGRGMSSFSYLKNLPVDFLKIDGSFVREISDSPVARAMVRSINEIGHLMNLKTVAEYVSDQATLERLREIGVDYAQGYALCEPRPLQELAGDQAAAK